MPQQQMSPIDRYRYDMEHNGFSEDAAQLNAVEHLQRLYEELIAWNNYQQLPALKRWLSKAPVKPKGLYFWGGVGRGKTYLVDTFIRRYIYTFIQTCWHLSIAAPVVVVVVLVSHCCGVLCNQYS